MAEHKITLTYLNIRQSIIILLAKLILNDLIAAFLLIGFYYFLVQGAQIGEFSFMNTTLFLIVFVIIGSVKIFLSGYIILIWLNEYYEITPEYIVYKRGIIFRKTEKYSLGNMRIMDIQDGFLGQLFNFATITFYDKILNKYLEMYFVHNPSRYIKVLKELKPNVEIRKDHVRLPLIPKEDDENVEK